MLVDKKILESERNQVYVKSNEGVRLNGSVAENKDVFDKFPQLIMNKYNELIDLLIASGLDTVADDFLNRYTKTETDSLIETETSTLVADIGVDLATGVITVTKKEGSKTTIDTALEKVPSTFEFVEDAENDKFYIKVTNVDGTSSQTEVTNLMNQYTFSDGDIVSFVISKSGTTTTVTANIKNGSIGLAQLSTEAKQYYEEIKSSVSADRAAVEADKTVVLDASQTVTANTALVLSYKEAAEENALLSKSYAIGNTGIRTGEDTDNSMYYSNEAKYARNQAQAAQAAAEKARDEAQEIAGGDYATKTELSNHTSDTTLHFTVDEKTKLFGIEANANNYTHPSSHPANMITEDSTHRFVTDTEKNAWSSKSDFSGEYKDLVNKPTVSSTTLLASNWDSTAKTYSFETNYPNASYDIEVSLDSTATSEHVDAFNGAQIVGSATSNIIKAYGDVPTVDIPVIIKVVTK